MVIAAFACPTSPLPAQSVPRQAALFTFVFDDGFFTDTLMAAEFATQGAVACSAVVTDWIGAPTHLSAEDIRGLQDAGWEILSHTRTHPHLSRLSESQIEGELLGSKTSLEALGVRVRNLVYPYNQANERVESVASKYYRSARGGGRAFNTPTTRPYALRSFPYEHDLEATKHIIDRACSEHAWLILYQHRVDVAVSIQERKGRYLAGETLDFSPSGCIAVCQKSAWSQVLGRLHFVPQVGSARPGDVVTGRTSGATGKLGRVLFDDFAANMELLRYLRSTHPDMPIVTIDQGLNILGFL
jgi:peptidoglycan/xylan/chitin deacetylase (PgdA/CDA1 family)